MSFIQLTGGAYQSRSLIAAAQRCLNLFVEPIPQSTGEPFLYSHFPTPGLTLEGVFPDDICRCLFTSSQGDLWAVYGNNVYWFDQSNVWHLIGPLTPHTLDDAAPRTTPVSMCDNGNQMLIVDGSSMGWTANVTTHDGMAPIDPTVSGNEGWRGGIRVDYSDTFFITSAPGTNIFYTSGSVATTFDPLDFASKAGKPDPLQSVIVGDRVAWLCGSQTYEIFFNSGGGGNGALVNNTFPFEALPGIIGYHGVAAPYSVCKANADILWLSKDITGKAIFILGRGQQTKRVSTFAIEDEVSAYPVISDCIGYTYQMGGHSFAVFNFPTADKCWCYDVTTDNWHERCWIDGDTRFEHRHLGNQASAAYGKVFVGDWRNGNLYSFDQSNFTDNGMNIKRLRSFPHQIDTEGNRRIMFKQLIANMEVGQDQQTGPVPVIIDCSFIAPDGTLLQNYTNGHDIGASFTKIGSTNAVINNDAIIAQASGSVLYKVNATPATADYILSRVVSPTFYVSPAPSGNVVTVIGRADTSHNGYLAAVSSDGSQYFATLTVMNTATTATLALGTLASGSFSLALTMTGSSISLAVQRSTDGNWLNASGSWVGSPAIAFQITDTTYQTVGDILIGGSWV